MTFKEDDEISKINERRLKEYTSAAKKHKLNVAQKGAEVVTPRKRPPVIAINSLLGEIFEKSFPLVEAEDDIGGKLTPKPVRVQEILDSLVKQYQLLTEELEKNGQKIEGGLRKEESVKAFAKTLKNVIRELGYLGFISLFEEEVNGQKDIYTCIMPKGIIYVNSLNYVASGNPIEHYLTFLQVGVA